MVDVFPANKRGYEDFNDFVEMLPLWFNRDALTLRILDRQNPEHNFEALIYEPHVERLLAERKAMTRRQWKEVVSRRRIAENDEWVNMMMILEALD